MMPMPFSGFTDPNLPPNVRKLNRRRRALWIETFNRSIDPADESAAWKTAWKAVRADFENKAGQTPAKDGLAMPWKIVEEDGEFCVYKENAEGEPAKKLKCYPSRADALAYQRALYANVEEKASEVGEIPGTLADSDELAHLRDMIASTEKRAWDEEAHPRHPEGDKRGGQFASKDEAGETESGRSDIKRKPRSALDSKIPSPKGAWAPRQDPDEVQDRIATTLPKATKKLDQVDEFLASEASDPDWGDVGTMSSVAESLGNLDAFVNNKGDFEYSTEHKNNESAAQAYARYRKDAQGFSRGARERLRKLSKQDKYDWGDAGDISHVIEILDELSILDEEEKAWDESKHPRDPAGTATGGQFTSADGAGESASPMPREPKISIKGDSSWVKEWMDANESQLRDLVSLRGHDVEITFGSVPGQPDYTKASGFESGFEVRFLDQQTGYFTGSVWVGLRQMSDGGVELGRIDTHLERNRTAKIFADKFREQKTLRALGLNKVEEKGAEARDVPGTLDGVDELVHLRDTIAATEKRAWDEEAHPRHPEGDARGGQFAPKDDAGESKKPRGAYQEPGTGWIKPAETTHADYVHQVARRYAVVLHNDAADVPVSGETVKIHKSNFGVRPFKLYKSLYGNFASAKTEYALQQFAKEMFWKVEETEKVDEPAGYRRKSVDDVAGSLVELFPSAEAQVAFKAYTQPDGRTRWVLVSSGGFEDRDGEVVSTAFLESAVQVADRTKQRGPLLIFHVPGSNIGTCDYQAVVGEPGFLLESGLFDDSEAGRRAAAYYTAHAKETGASIKFLFANRTSDGTYMPPGAILERSLMRRERAAFPWSALALPEVMDMAKMSQEKRSELEEVLGEDLAVQIIDQIETSAEALKQAGVRSKEAAGETTNEAADAPAAQPQEEAQTASKESLAEAAEAGGEFELVLTPEAIDAVAEKAAGAVTGIIAELASQLQNALAGLNDLRTAVEKNQRDLAALQRNDEAKIAEKVAHLPRATVRQIQAPELYRATRDKQASEPDEHETEKAAVTDPLAHLKKFVNS